MANPADARQMYQYIFNTSTSLRYWSPGVVAKDCTNMFTMYRGLTPEVHEYNFVDGTCYKLLRFTGTVPISYKGSKFNIPVCVWIMYDYPVHAPMLYVEPTSNMCIIPSEVVDVNGVVRLPVLEKWNYPGLDLLSTVQFMCVAFSEKPPVCTKESFLRSQYQRVQQHQRQQQQQQQQQTPVQQTYEEPNYVEQQRAPTNQRFQRNTPQGAAPKLPARPPPSRPPALRDRQKSADSPRPERNAPLLNKAQSLDASRDPGHIKKAPKLPDNIKKSATFSGVVQELNQSICDGSALKPGGRSLKRTDHVKKQNQPVDLEGYEIPAGGAVAGKRTDSSVQTQFQNLILDDAELGSDFLDDDIYEDLDSAVKATDEVYETLESFKRCGGCHSGLLALMRCEQCKTDLCGGCIAKHDQDAKKRSHKMQDLK